MASVAITEAAECLTILGQYDEAAAVYEEGIQRDEKRGDLSGVAGGRCNLGTVRLQQKRYGEALEGYREALRIFEAMGEPLTVAGIQYQIGMAYCNAGQFEQAEQAKPSYLAYRRAGGESQSNVAGLYARVFQAIQQGAMTEAEQYFDELSRRDIPALLRTLVAGLRAILRGDRDPSLAADPNLSYNNAAELQLLLEALHAK